MWFSNTESFTLQSSEAVYNLSFVRVVGGPVYDAHVFPSQTFMLPLVHLQIGDDLRTVPEDRYGEIPIEYALTPNAPRPIQRDGTKGK